MPAFDQDAYWIARHQKYRGDPRSVGNIGKTIAQAEAGDQSIRRAVAAALKLLNAKGSVFDIGCGYGRLAPVFCDAKLDYLGLDVSHDAIEAARSFEPRGRYIQGSALTADWSGPFDVIAACYVLVHFVDDRDWANLLQRMVAALRTDGCLLIADEFPETERSPSPHVRQRPLAAYASALAKMGMTLDMEFHNRLRGANHIHLARFGVR